MAEERCCFVGIEVLWKNAVEEVFAFDSRSQEIPLIAAVDVWVVESADMVIDAGDHALEVEVSPQRHLGDHTASRVYERERIAWVVG